MRSRLIVVLLLAAAPVLAQQAPNLGTATSFAVLAGLEATGSDGVRVAGNVGVSPGRAVSGLSPVPGDVYRDDALARQAQKDNATAYRDLATRPCAVSTSLAGVITPGVYCVSSAVLDGTLTLDAQANPGAVWIFRIAGGLTTAPQSMVAILNGGREGNIFWQVGATVSLGAGSTFRGTVLALGDISADRDATVSGRLLTQNGAVTLKRSNITICCERVTFTTTTLPRGNTGAPYAASVVATGGIASYKYSRIDGMLPPGLELHEDGTITGTPKTCSGSFTFTVAATDHVGCPGDGQFTIDIDCTTPSAPTLSFVTTALLVLVLAIAGCLLLRGVSL